MRFSLWVGARGVGLASVWCAAGCASRPLSSVATPVGSAQAPAPSNSASSEVAKLCGGIAGVRCEAQQYCVFAPSARCGAGDMSGTCKQIPGMCTMEYAPVCGCDRTTYSNACVAARSGVSVAATGGCPEDNGGSLADGALCGTRGVPGTCAASSYCAYKSQCGETDSGGICRRKPEICSDVYAAVCGCDGKTYPSACYAERAGMTVQRAGACAADQIPALPRP